MPQLIPASATNHGVINYLLTGTQDFSYLLEKMEKDKLITAAQRSTLQGGYDGYRLQFSHYNMVRAVNDTTNDTNAICLTSADSEGAICAGIYYDGSSVKVWGRFVSKETFAAATTSPFTEPTGTDISSSLYLQDPSLDTTVTITGAAATSWTVYRFQPNEAESYTNDYRFDPTDANT